jgi:hypothetical protein
LPGDPADVASWHPRYAPLSVNWRYAAASRAGGFEDAQGRPRHGGAHTIEALFGIMARTEEQARAPTRFEDRAGRHLWWRLWSELLGVRGVWLWLPCLLVAAIAGAIAARGVGFRDSR